jgi:integrase
MQSEVLTLEWRQIDLEAGTVRLDPGSTKNDDGRVVYLTPELKSLLATQLEHVRGLEREMEVFSHIFSRTYEAHTGGSVFRISKEPGKLRV